LKRCQAATHTPSLRSMRAAVGERLSTAVT